MEPVTSWRPLHAHLEKTKQRVDRVASRDARISLDLAWQVLVVTPLALAHTAWSRMWLVFLTFVTIAAVGNPAGRVTAWLASSAGGLAIVWLGVTVLSLAVFYAVLLTRFVSGYWRYRAVAQG